MVMNKWNVVAPNTVDSFKIITVVLYFFANHLEKLDFFDVLTNEVLPTGKENQYNTNILLYWSLLNMKTPN